MALTCGALAFSPRKGEEWSLVGIRRLRLIMQALVGSRARSHSHECLFIFLTSSPKGLLD